METPTLRAWKGPDAPTYIVQVGNSMYEMSDDANLPNGVCIYQGTARDLAWTVREPAVYEVPLGVMKQVVRLLREGH